MFDIGWTEILIIAVVAVIIVGPKDLPRMLRSLGRYAGQLRRTAGEFRSQFDDAIRESELDELRNTIEDASSANPVSQIRDSVNESLNPLKETANEIKGGIEAPASDDKPAKQKKTQAANKPAAKSSATKPAAKKPAKAKSAQRAGADSGG